MSIEAYKVEKYGQELLPETGDRQVIMPRDISDKHITDKIRRICMSIDADLMDNEIDIEHIALMSQEGIIAFKEILNSLYEAK